MKKTYQKPMVNIERFELSQHIAACMNKVDVVNHAVKEGCNLVVPQPHVPNQTIKPFMNIVNTRCEHLYEEECYTGNAMGDNYIFGS